MTSHVRRIFTAALIWVARNPPSGFTLNRNVDDMDDTTLFVVVALALFAYYLQGSGVTIGIGAAPSIPAGPVGPVGNLPDGYATDEGVAFAMFKASMERHGLDPIGVQGHGQTIAAALNADYPGLNAYAHAQSDALMWPGFGSVDVTIDSGKGGWSFRVDGLGVYGEGR